MHPELAVFSHMHVEGAWKLSREMSWSYRLEDWRFALGQGQGFVLQRGQERGESGAARSLHHRQRRVGTQRRPVQRRMAVDTNHMVTYFGTTPDNRLLPGGRARFAVSNETSDRKSGANLQASLRRIFPDLDQARIDYCWGGMVDMTRDRLPRAGERNGTYYSMGYSGHGTQMSTLMGSIMAEVMDGRTDLNPWKDFDWPAIPGHFGKPWFLPLVGAWYRLKDRLS